MKVPYQRISKSWVACHPNPKGVVEFYGGQLFGQFPTVSYDYFLEQLYSNGFSIIAVPFQFGFNHAEIAYTLLNERKIVLNSEPSLKSLPLFWVGHSVGCKYIALLEAYTDSKDNTFKMATGSKTMVETEGILNQPSLLLAPDISDTSDSVPVPFLANLLDTFNLGVRPTRTTMQDLVVKSDLFNLTAMLSFKDDNVAGNLAGDPDKSDVAWFYETLNQKTNQNFYNQEIEGDHLEPLGVQIGPTVYDITSVFDLIQQVPRLCDSAALELLSQLEAKCSGKSIPKPSAAKSAQSNPPIKITFENTPLPEKKPEPSLAKQSGLTEKPEPEAITQPKQVAPSKPAETTEKPEAQPPKQPAPAQSVSKPTSDSSTQKEEQPGKPLPAGSVTSKEKTQSDKPKTVAPEKIAPPVSGNTPHVHEMKSQGGEKQYGHGHKGKGSSKKKKNKKHRR